MSRAFARINIRNDCQAGSYTLAIGPMAIRVDPPGPDHGWPCDGAAASDLGRKFDSYAANPLRAYVTPRYGGPEGVLWLESDHPLAHWLNVRVAGAGASVEMLT